MKKLFVTVCMALAIVTSGVAQRYINNRTDLETFRNEVNKGTTFSDQTVYLNVDIDLGGASWTPIGNKENEGDTGFAGTFDGQGHTIFNFKVSLNNEVGKWASASEYGKNAFGGLWGINNGTIKNLKVSGANVSTKVNGIGSTAASGAIAGLNRGTINNCQVINSTMTATQNYEVAGTKKEHMALAGGIAGASRKGSAVKNCYVSGNSLNTSVKSGWGANAGSEKNDIACTWQTESSASISNCASSDYETFRKNRVDAAVAYINFGGAEDEPYYWDANGITPHIPYAFRVDAANARIAATYATVVDDTYTHNNATYNLYPAGHVIDVTAYPQGVATDNADAGYKLAHNDRADIDPFKDDFAHNSNGRYYRSQTAKVTIPTTKERTNATVLSMEHTGLYGVSLENPAENISNTLLADFDKSAAQVFNGAYFYNAGAQVPVTVYPLGMNVNGEDDGYLLRNADALGAERTDLTTVEGDRYVRKFVYNHTVTSGKNTIKYEVEESGMYRLTLADHGVDPAVRYDAAILTEPTMVTSPEGVEFPMYRGGQDVTLEFYLEGFSGNWSNAGYFVDELIINNSYENNLTASYVWDASNDEEGNPTYSFDTDRFLRKMQYEITMPHQVTEVGYTTMTTIPTDVEEVVAATRIYGVNGAVVVEAEAAQEVVVADMSGRIVYNGVVSQGRNAIELAAGFYLVNGTKVAVR